MPKSPMLTLPKKLLTALLPYGDDVLIVAGCCAILAGTYQLSPVAAYFVAGVELIALGILIGLGGRAK